MQSAAAVRRQGESGPEQRSTILFVDDEPRVLNSMRIMFRRHFNVVLADNGAAALDLLRQQPVDVIVADHRMPHMTGVELLSEVRQRSPDTVRILLTGYADLESIEGSINDGGVFRFLTKPCQAAELRATIGLAAEVAADTSQSDIASAEVQASAHAPAATVHRTVATARPVPEAGFPKAVLLFSSDSSLAEMTRQALPADTRVYVSANLVEVIETLEARQPGVLVTDVSGEREVIEQMTMQLKQHVPELVTVVASEFSDSAELIRLINCGQVFRYLRKPVTPGRLRVSVNAAVSYHQRLVADPGQMQRHVVNAAAPPAASAGGMLSSIMTRIHHLGRSWRTG